jgi:hypothetical protein
MKSIFLYSLLLFFALNIFGQVRHYNVKSAITNYVKRDTGGVQLGNASNNINKAFFKPSQLAGHPHNEYGEGFDIGFDFIYNGKVHKKFGVSNNGFIIIKDVNFIAAPQLNPISKGELLDRKNDSLLNYICPFATRLQGNGTSSKLEFFREGVFPNRKLIVQWSNYNIYPNLNTINFPNKSNANFQVILYEIDNSIEFNYGKMGLDVLLPFYEVPKADIGLAGYFHTDVSVIKNDGITSLKMYQNTSTLSFKDRFIVPLPIDSTNVSIKFTSKCSPPKPTWTKIAPSLATFNWVRPSSQPNDSFFFKLDTIPFTNSSLGIFASTENITLNNLIPGTQYYLHMKCKCLSADTINSVWETVPLRTQVIQQSPYSQNFNTSLVDVLHPHFFTNNEKPTPDWKVLNYNQNQLRLDYSFLYPNRPNWLFFPPFIFQKDSTYLLQFVSENGSYNPLHFYIGKTPLPDSMQLLYVINQDSYSNLYDSKKITMIETDTFYIGLNSNSMGSINIDDIEFHKDDCDTLQNIQYVRNNGTDITMKWNSNGFSANYAVGFAEYGLPSSYDTVNVDSILLTGLIPSKKYNGYIRRLCGAGYNSSWQTFTFTTSVLNDECFEAEVIIPGVDSSNSPGIYANTLGSSQSPQSACLGSNDDDLWYKFQATSRSHAIVLNPEFNPTTEFYYKFIVELYKGTCNNMVLVDCYDTNDEYEKRLLRTDYKVDSTYFIRVFTKDDSLNLTFSISIKTFAPDSTDNCNGAAIVESSQQICDYYLTYRSNFAMTTVNSGATSSCSSNASYDLWTKYIVDDSVKIFTANFFNGGNGAMQIFKGNCNSFQELTCVDSTTNGVEMSTLRNLINGETLYIRLIDQSATGGDIPVELCITIPYPNENCLNAEEIYPSIGILFEESITANTIGTIGQGSCNGNFADDDLWYKFTATDTLHLIVVQPIQNRIINPVIELFNGNCNSASLACHQNELEYSNFTIGNEYYFRIYSSALNSGQGQFELTITTPQLNAKCANIINIPTTNSGTCKGFITGTTVGCGLENTVWYKFQAFNQKQTIMLDYADHEIYLYSDCMTQLIPLQDYYESKPVIQYDSFVIGNTYYIKVVAGQFEGQYFQYNFNLCISSPPVNDERQNAINITPGIVCENPKYGTNIGATTANDSLACLNYYWDIWYKFVATKIDHQVGVEQNDVANGVYTIYTSLYHANDSIPITCSDNINKFINAVGLTIGDTYYIKVASRFPYYGFQSYDTLFKICVKSQPGNGVCTYAKPLYQSATYKCISEFGSTIDLTPENSTDPGTWFKFTYQGGDIGLKVTPLTEGFDPVVQMWNAKDTITNINCGTQMVSSIVNIEHRNFMPEYFMLFNTEPYVFKIGKEYLIKVSDGSAIQGDFEICLFRPSNDSRIYDVTQESYDMDPLVTYPDGPVIRHAQSGKWNQAVNRIAINISQGSQLKKISKLEFVMDGTTNLDNVLSAKVYIDILKPFSPSPYRKFYSHPELGFLTSKPRPFQFGQTIINPGELSSLIFTDDFDLSGSNLLGGEKKFIYLVYDLKCSADTGTYINAYCTNMIVDDENIEPYMVYDQNIPVLPFNNIYETRNGGDWEDENNWICKPNNGPDKNTIVNHDMIINDTINTGNISVMNQQKIKMNPSSQLTIGGSSDGALNGYSNKVLDCLTASFEMDAATLIVNGQARFGASAQNNPDGICCNDGYGSYKIYEGDVLLKSGAEFFSEEIKSFCLNGILPQVPDTLTPLENSRNNNGFELFKLSKSRTTSSQEAFKDEVLNVDIDVESINTLLTRKLKNVKISVPFIEEQQYTLDLKLNTALNDLIVTAAKTGRSIPIKKGLHYIGKVHGYDHSYAAISIFENEISGIISTDRLDGNINISKNKDSDLHLIYSDKNLKTEPSFQCNTPEENLRERLSQERHTQLNSEGGCIHMYLEVDYDVYQSKGSVQNTTNFILSIYNQVNALFADFEYIDTLQIKVSQINIWTEASPYNGTTSDEMLKQFNEYRTSFDGDLAQLISFRASGGIAYLDGLCEAERKYSMSYASIFNSVTAFPIYSWTTLVCAHELGHQLGSPHTHACAWNGNNTPIDGCYPKEGNCTAAAIPVGGGTIMSYCHLNPVGINFSNGFGSQPKQKIINTIFNRKCLQHCDNITCNQGNLTIEIITDNNPDETSWELLNSQNQVVGNGGPYYEYSGISQKQRRIIHKLCLPLGCYKFKIKDNKGNKLTTSNIFKNSKIIIDPNDGVEATSWNGTALVLGNHNTSFVKSKIKFKDIAKGMAMTYDVQIYPTTWDVDLEFGGGDDRSIPLLDSFYRIYPYNPNYQLGLVTFDTILINDPRRKVTSIYTMLSGNHIEVTPQGNFEGSLGAANSINNNGLITIGINNWLSFGSAFNTVGVSASGFTLQRLFGNGRFRSNKNDAIPVLALDNNISNLFIANGVDKGLKLDVPLTVLDRLRLKSGKVISSDTTLLTLGKGHSVGRIASEKNDYLFEIDSFFHNENLNKWDGGYVQGPFRRRFTSTSNTVNKILFPIGDSLANRTLSIRYNAPTNGYVTARFTQQSPSQIGMPLLNEQGTSDLKAASAHGFWKVEENGLSGNYKLKLNLKNFPETPYKFLTETIATSGRIVRRESGNNTWINSASPALGSLVKIDTISMSNVSGSAEYGFSTNLCYIVTNGNDSGVGSLRYVLGCVHSPNQGIVFAPNVDTINITSSPILIEVPNGSYSIFRHIYNTNNNAVVIKQNGSPSLFKTGIGSYVYLRNLTFQSNSGGLGRAINNGGQLFLFNTVIKDAGNLNIAPLYNTNYVEFSGTNFLKKLF